MTRPKILFVCGSLNQTRMMHQVSQHLRDDFECVFSPYFADGFVQAALKSGLLEPLFNRTVLSGHFKQSTLDYLAKFNERIEDEGRGGPYVLALTGSDLIVPASIRRQPLILIQEGMVNPENPMAKLTRKLGLPLWMGMGTALTGESLAYDQFCVASDGYRDFFATKGRGVPLSKLVVTGIPNFDNCQTFLKNDFDQKDYVLVCTSDMRETSMPDDRIAFLKKCFGIAAGRKTIFKLHPNENFVRAKREIASVFADAQVFTSGSAEDMVANSNVLITQWSTLAYVGLALGKEVHSYFDINELKRLLPWQNGGQSGFNISKVCRALIQKQQGPNL